MKKMLSIVLSALMLCASLVGCSSKSDVVIRLNGSTSMEKVVNILAEAYMEANKNVTVEAQFTGSSSGIEALINGSADIGDASRAIKDAEKEAGVVENVIAIDGIAVIVSNDQSVKALTKQQLIDIYTGVVTNWKEVGGQDQPIVVIGRESSSGTRSAFEELLGIEDACNYAQEVDSTGGVVAKVKETQGAIGYASLDVLDGQVTALALDGVEATVENIKGGQYFLSRPFVMATKGSISEQNDDVKAFLEFVLSDEGQSYVESVGLISVK
ncbi:MAG: phosphate ABC transporter substrate-binding protein [Traorella sp.]